MSVAEQCASTFSGSQPNREHPFLLECPRLHTHTSDTELPAEQMAEKDLAKDESLRLTRSSTIFHALVRIFGSGKLPSRLVLHVVGADHRYVSTETGAAVALIEMMSPRLPRGLRSSGPRWLQIINERGERRQEFAVRDASAKRCHNKTFPKHFCTHSCRMKLPFCFVASLQTDACTLLQQI